MSGRDHDRVSGLFLQACEIPPERRAAFLDEACAGDARLRAEVESLLIHDESVPEILKPGAIPLDVSPAAEPIPERIGRFRILEKLAEGGMGVVYRAEQERPIRREVAVKLIRLGIESGEVLSRFESERQALALMHHPNIALVLDAGTTKHGRPFFAMEYVSGNPITEYCEQRRLSIQERLELFLQVCEGVRHAHQKAIIHRDIKPSNVLVTTIDGHPIPKIIDFGIAKAIGKKGAQHGSMTGFGQLIGTPEYMSPEQAQMGTQDVDTRTDVYSLGILLYELLVGVPTFDSDELRKQSFEEMLRRIREDDPLRPSSRVVTLPDVPATAARRRTDPRTLARRLSGDLDLIAMKALHKEPSLRYASPADLAEDIRRHLRDEPILASPPGTWYRLGKLVRRHKAGFGFTAAIAILLLGFAISMAYQANRVALERDRASAAANTAERTLDFTMGLLELYAPRNTSGTGEAAQEMLDRSLAKIERELGDQPLAQAQLLVNSGRVYRNLGLHNEARRVLEQGLEQLRQLVGEDHPQTLQAKGDLAFVYFYERDFKRAEPLFLEALEGLTHTLGPNHQATLKTMKNLANFHTARGEYTEAERLNLESMERLRGALGDEHPLTLRATADLGILYRVSGRYDEAEPLLLDALADHRRILGDDDPFTLSSMNSLALLYQIQDRRVDAEPLYRESLERKRRVLGASHPSTLKTMYNLACLAALEMRQEEALTLLDEATGLGFIGNRIAEDPDLRSLHGNPRFEAIVARARQQTGGE
jgi:serine/threonine protein kinase/tetratricopeptide (TPR) repeat protein